MICQAGIGTYTVPQIATPFYSKVSKALDAAIAWNLDASARGHLLGELEEVPVIQPKLNVLEAHKSQACRQKLT